MFHDILPDEFIERFFLNAAFLLILLRFVYYNYSRDRDSLFGFFLFGHGVYLVTGLMHEINISMGFAFGLFAVLSMLRYRTESISIRDMTYLFLVIVMSLMAAVGPVGILSLMLINSVLVIMVWCTETTGFAPRTVQKSVVYDNIVNIRPQNRQALVRDLQERLGEDVVAVVIKSVDFLKDTAVLQVTLSASADISTRTIENNNNEKILSQKLKKVVPALVSLLATLNVLAVVTPSQVQTDFTSNDDASTFKTALKKHNIKVEGMLMLDMTQTNGIYVNDEPASDVAVRRARLGLGGDISQRLSAEFTVDLEVEESTASMHEAKIDYEWTKALESQAGLVKQPFGLEGSTSSKHLRTLERSMPSEAFVPERGIGVAISHDSSGHYLSLGAYRDRDVEEVQYVTARATWSPIESKRKVLHVGASVSQRDNAGAEYRVRSSGNIASGDNFLKSGRFNPESITTAGVEGAWSYGSLLVQAEWFLQSLALAEIETAKEPRFQGGYIQTGWVFNHGYRKYDGGRFGKIAGTNNKRALELVGGVGIVDVRHAGRGDQAREFTLGLNYQLTKVLSLGGQVQSVTALDDNESLDSGEGVQLRMVAVF